MSACDVVAATVVETAVARGLKLSLPSQVRETMGAGLEGTVDGRAVRVGSLQLVYGARKPERWAARALRRAAWRSALSVFVAVDGQTIGAVLLADELRRDTPHAVQALRAAGVSRIVMVTGDRADAAETSERHLISMPFFRTASRPTRLTLWPASSASTPR